MKLNLLEFAENSEKMLKSSFGAIKVNVVNVPQIQITQCGCSSKIPSENLTFIDIEMILVW